MAFHAEEAELIKVIGAITKQMESDQMAAWIKYEDDQANIGRTLRLFRLKNRVTAVDVARVMGWKHGQYPTMIELCYRGARWDAVKAEKYIRAIIKVRNSRNKSPFKMLPPPMHSLMRKPARRREASAGIPIKSVMT